MIDLTEVENKFYGRQICSPEVARAIAEFESTTVLKGEKNFEFYHRKDSLVFKEGFQSIHMIPLQKNSNNFYKRIRTTQWPIYSKWLNGVNSVRYQTSNGR